MGRWLPARDAATALGIAEITLKRRIKTGQVEARKEKMTRGWRYLVEVPDDLSADTAQSPTTHLESTLSEIVRLLREENQKLLKQLDDRSREVSELHVLIERLTRQETPLIEAPQTPVSAESLDRSEIPQVTPQSRRGVWWRIWSRR